MQSLVTEPLSRSDSFIDVIICVKLLKSALLAWAKHTRR